MSKHLRSSFFLALISSAILLALPACAEDVSRQPQSAEAVSEGEADLAATAEPAEAEELTGLAIRVDGSSLETFEASLAEIQETTTEKQYKTLENAIDYLLVYDLGAKGDKAKLASRLNGLSGQEILDRVRWQGKSRPRTNRE